MNESSKNQAPNPKETPIIKLQTPASPVDSIIGDLGFGIYLEFGTWDLELYLATDN